MIVNQEQITKIFSLNKTGQKGWFIGGPCPYCGKDKLAIIFDSTVCSFTCKYCSQHGSLYILLKKINRLDLISFQPKISISEKLIPKINIEKEEIKFEEVSASSLPLGFQLIFADEYLKDRGFTKEQFIQLNVGISREQKWKDYIIFLVVENGICKGYLGRSKKSKKWIELYNQKLKEKGIKKKYLRWENSKSDFGNLVFGIDEIVVGKTKTIIAVEGVTSKANIDRLLDLYSQEEIKSNATFGKKLTIQQMKKWQDRGIENVILLYDPDAIEASKQYSIELNKYFNVKVGFIFYKKENGEDKDPGDLNFDELVEILLKLEDPISFNSGKIQPNLRKDIKPFKFLTHA